MENSFSPYRFRCHEITAEQILCHCAFIITAVGRPMCFIDFVIRSAPRMARPDTREIGLRPHTSDAWRYHLVRLRFRSSYRYCARVRFCANPFEVICAPSFGRYTQITRRKMRLLTAAYQDPGTKRMTNVPSGSHPKEGVRIASNVALE